MIVINTIDEQTFSLNGINYTKNFVAIRAGEQSLMIVNLYDTKFQLLEPTKFDEITCDGIIHTSLVNLMNAITSVLFFKKSLKDLPYIGSIVPSSVSSDSTGAAFWTATQPGIYANYGDVVVKENSFAVISKNDLGVYTISQTPLDFSVYATSGLFDKSATLSTERKNKLERLITSINVADVINSQYNYWIGGISDITSNSFTISIRSDDPAVPSGFLMVGRVVTKAINTFDIQDYVLSGSIVNSITSKINITVDWGYFNYLDSDFFLGGANVGVNVSILNKASLAYANTFPLGAFSMVRGVSGKVDEEQLTGNLVNNNYYQQQRTNSNIFRKESTYPMNNRTLIEKFILKMDCIKGYSSDYDYWISTFSVISNSPQTVRLTIKTTDPLVSGSSQNYILIQDIIYRGKQVDTYRLLGFLPIYEIDVTVDWNEFIFGNSTFGIVGGTVLTTPIRRSLAYNGTVDVSSFVKIDNIFKYDLTKINPFTGTVNTNIKLTQQSDGIRYVLNVPTGANTNYTISSGDILRIDKNKIYCVYIDYTVNNFNGAGSETSLPDYFSFSLTRTGIGASKSFSLEQQKGRIRGVAVSPISASAEYSNQFRFTLTHRNNKPFTGEVIDVTLHNIMVIDLGFSSDYLVNKTTNELTTLFQEIGYFESLTIAKNSFNVVNSPSIYSGKKLISYGDSVTQTGSFQPLIAKQFGMIFNETILKTGSGGFQPTAIGGTKLVPVVYGSESQLQTGKSIYMRAKEAKNYSPDILMLLAGFNDNNLNTKYVPEQPLITEYGLLDAPWTGGEINLITNPSATVPSFGASLRGLIVGWQTEMPFAKIIIATLYMNPIASETIKESWRLRNTVIRAVAKEFSLPLIDLEYNMGISQYNYLSYLKNEASPIHPNRLGGERMAQIYIANL